MNFWYSQNLVAWSLLPLSWLYCMLALTRRKLYQWRLLASHKPAVPVVVIGNITVGGTGKTPLLIAICEWLQQHGVQVGVVSRGYGGNFRGIHNVHAGDDAEHTGDEPLLIQRRCGCPIVIGRDRAAAADYLLQQHGCDIILGDDGMQHYALQRDAEIAVIDAAREHGNGFCLPAGPLRERPSRLRDVDIIAINHAGCQHGASPKDPSPGFCLQITRLRNLAGNQSASIADFAGRQVHAVAGIGHPQRFFAQLRAGGIDIIEHAFGDHHAFSKDDIHFDDDLPVLMTEKDAVKCQDFSDQRHWAVVVEARLNPALQQQLSQLLQRLGVME